MGGLLPHIQLAVIARQELSGRGELHLQHLVGARRGQLKRTRRQGNAEAGRDTSRGDVLRHPG